MSLKKYKYRVKDLSNDIEDAFKCHKVVQVKKWYGWVTIKEFPIFYYNDGTVRISEPNDKHYVDICIEELLDALNEDI